MHMAQVCEEDGEVVACRDGDTLVGDQSEVVDLDKGISRSFGVGYLAILGVSRHVNHTIMAEGH